MTKDEMMEKYYPVDEESNYKKAQDIIKACMCRGEKFVYLPGKINKQAFSWVATKKTIQRLREDGFDVDKVWKPNEFWSIEWGY